MVIKSENLFQIPKVCPERTVILKSCFQTHHSIPYQQNPIFKICKAYLLQLISPNSQIFPFTGPFNFPQMTHFPKITINSGRHAPPFCTCHRKLHSHPFKMKHQTSRALKLAKSSTASTGFQNTPQLSSCWVL